MNKFRLLLPLLFAGLLTPPLQADPTQAKVSSVTGPVTYAQPGSSEFKNLSEGMQLQAGSKIRTGKNGEAVVVIVPGAAMQISPNSEVTVDSMSVNETASGETAKRKALVSLSNGTVSALIDPKRSKETDFKIQTPQGVAAARGTFYAVTVENGKTYVGVKKGKVGVAHTPN
jgi:hypothetical protein